MAEATNNGSVDTTLFDETGVAGGGAAAPAGTGPTATSTPEANEAIKTRKGKRAVKTPNPPETDAEVREGSGSEGGDTGERDVKRSRRTPLFPASTFEDALQLASDIYRFGSGQPVRRITLFDSLGKSPESGLSRQLITNSAKYGLTTGSYKADVLALTPEGLQSVADDVSAATRARARFKLAIEIIDVFRRLYDAYLGNRLPAQAVLADKAREVGVPNSDVAECIETFTVNMKFVGVLRSISGAERILPIDTVLDDYLPSDATRAEHRVVPVLLSPRTMLATGLEISERDFGTSCFYITPIGDEGSEERKHSDLFMGALIEPPLAEFGLKLVRADRIGEAGMISRQVIEYIVYSRLVIADLSFHNPNVFYELALRHSTRKPIVQLCRAADKLPFDVGQVRTIVVDTADIYTLVPQLESLKAQIAAQIRKTLDEQAEVENPLSVFAPYFWDELPGQKGR